MSSFIQSTACKGRRPEGIAASHVVSRPDLVARLLRERHVARFLVAPDGFGKTQLAIQYAETVFAFAHVFWVNGKSPCFLRDLDAEAIASGLRAQDKTRFLAVFEDVPRLDDMRVDRFSRVVDELLEAGNEVLVTCTPSCDAYGNRHRDRLRLAASDLLLSEAECKVSTPLSPLPQKEGRVAVCERVACLRWGGDDGTKLVTGLVREELPGDVLLAMFSMLALREGEWSDLSAFVPAGLNEALAAALEEGYPYLGLDKHSETYRTVDLPMPVLAAAFDRAFDSLSARSLFGDRHALVRRIADALVVRGEGERACQCAAGLSPKPQCALWLAARSHVLMSLCCVKPAHDLYRFVGRVRGPERWALNVAEAWRLVALEDEKPALSSVRRMAFSPDVPEGVRASALVILSYWGAPDASARAVDTLRMLVRSGSAFRTENESTLDAATDSAFWFPAARMLLSLRDGFASALDEWRELESSDCGDDLLFAVAAGMMHAAAKEAFDTVESECLLLLRETMRFVRDRVLKASPAPLSLFEAMAILQFEKVIELGILPNEASLPAEIVLKARSVELSLFSQRGAYRRSVAAAADAAATFDSTHPDTFRDGRRVRGKSESSAVAPVLHVDLFGGLSVRIGDDPVSFSLLRRQKSRTLLALLVVNRGKEVPRDRLVQELWPESELETARRNFYAVWSQLRRALVTPFGTCPYLVRAQSGFRLESRLFESDLDAFDSLCRTLLFGRPRADEWESLFAQVTERYSEDLLPGEEECAAIVQARDDCRTRLVDALVSASSQLAEAGEVRGGLWFAREALKHEHAREDVYAALMEAQIAAGQRTAALETYFSCRRYLADELGIDPSVRTVRLYRSIIEAEEEFDW